MWESIDRLSTIPPFNQVNRGNHEPNLAVHIEKNPQVWFHYVNNADFVNDAQRKLSKREEERKRARLSKMSAGSPT